MIHTDSAYSLASLAAMICPVTCRKNPSKAISIAHTLVAEAADALADPHYDCRELRQMAEAYDAETDAIGHQPFEAGVKLITAEGRMVRAMPKFRRFLMGLGLKEKQTDQIIVSCRKAGFSPREVRTMNEKFSVWSQTDKSEQARRARAARKK